MNIKCNVKTFESISSEGITATPFGIVVNCYDDSGKLLRHSEYELGFDKRRIIAFSDALNSSDFEFEHLKYFIDDYLAE